MAKNSSDALIVHGIVVDSLNEWNVAMALDRLKIEYAYQKYLGGVGIRGSHVIDFLCYTTPKPTPVFVHGEYWHSGRYAVESAFAEADINARMRGTWAKVVILWENECETEEQAFEVLQLKLGV